MLKLTSGILICHKWSLNTKWVDCWPPQKFVSFGGRGGGKIARLLLATKGLLTISLNNCWCLLLSYKFKCESWFQLKYKKYDKVTMSVTWDFTRRNLNNCYIWNDAIHSQLWPIFYCFWMNFPIISLWHIIQINSLNEVISHGTRTSPHTAKFFHFLPWDRNSAFGLLPYKAVLFSLTFF